MQNLLQLGKYGRRCVEMEHKLSSESEFYLRKYESEVEFKRVLVENLVNLEGDYGPNSFEIMIFILDAIKKLAMERDYPKLMLLYGQAEEKIDLWLKNGLFVPHLILAYSEIVCLTTSEGSVEDNLKLLLKLQEFFREE